MNLAVIKSFGGPTVQRGLLKLSKYAPEILTGVGIAGVVGGTVLIARATLNVEPIITRHENRIADNKDMRVMTGDDGETPAFTQQEITRDLVGAYVKTTLDLTKLYAAPVTLELASIASILAAHGIMKRRAVALLGAYKAVESAFAAYRSRVIEEYGEDKDRDFRLGFRTEKIEDPETGKKTTVRTFDPDHVSQYAKFFDEGNPNWKGSAEYNLMFLKLQQSWANDKLRMQGHLFLSEVYDMLGFETTAQAQVVGWVMDPKNGGDLHVDFNIYNADSIKARDFVNGLESSILLDFNVDGVILDLI